MFNGCDHSKEAGTSVKPQPESKPETKIVSPAKVETAKAKQPQQPK